MAKAGIGLSVISILLGLFGILAPGAAWLALVFGVVASVQDGVAIEAASTFALLGSYGLAMGVVLSSPLGLALALAGAVVSRVGGVTMLPAFAGLGLNLLAPLTWALTWAGLVGGVLWLFQDFHW